MNPLLTTGLDLHRGMTALSVNSSSSDRGSSPVSLRILPMRPGRLGWRNWADEMLTAREKAVTPVDSQSRSCVAAVRSTHVPI